MVTVNTTNITGFIVLPNDAIREKSSVIFTMTGFDTDADDNATIVPIPVVAAIGSDGSIDQDLWPNPEGVRATFYRVTFSMYNGVNPVLVDGGLIEVPATGGPYDLNDLLPIAPPSGATVEEYIAQLAAAVASASSSAGSAETDAAAAADSAQEAADIVAGLVPAEPSFVLSIGASAIAGSSGATGGSLDVLPGVSLWDSNSNGATYVAGTQFNTAAFGTDPLNVNSGLANSTPLHAMNGVRQLVGGNVYGAFLAMGGQDPEALITDATLAANSWTRDPGDEDLTLQYSNIQSAIDAMPGSKTVADYLIYYQHNNSGTGRDYYQPRVKAILDDLVTAGLIDDTTKIVLVEANPDRSDAIIESVQDSLTDIASRDYPNAVTVGQGGISTHDGIHPSGVGCVWLGQRIAQGLLGGGIIPTQRIVFTDGSNNDLESITELNKWNGDNYRIRHTNDAGYIEANWNAQSQAWRVTGTGDVDYMRVESTGIEDTPIGADTPSTGDFTDLVAATLTGGAVQSSTTDATADKVLLNGAHGLGATTVPPAPGDDCNNITVTGFSAFENVTANRPADFTNGIIWHGARTSTIHTQFAISRATATLGRAAVRANDGTAWSDWREIVLFDDNLNLAVGTTDAWTFAGTWRGVKVSDRHAIQGTTGASSVALSSNSAIGASGWEYTVSDDAGRYTIDGDLHLWHNAAAGTDGDPVTWDEAMRLDADGRLHIGHDGSTSTPGVGNSTAGTSIHAGGRTIHSRDSGPTQDLARVGATPDGQIQRFYRSGSEVGSISVKAGAITLDMTASGVVWTPISGTPEGFLSAPVGSMCTRVDGGAGATLYVKESGTGNTGWVAK